MADIIHFQPKHEISAKQNLDSFIEHCKNTLTLYDDQGGWQSNNWQHKQKNRSIAMTFSKYRASQILRILPLWMNLSCLLQKLISAITRVSKRYPA